MTKAREPRMCFSASASFVAAGALLPAGAYTMRRARTPSELPYAAIPVLFGLQQLIEGVIWLTFGWDGTALNAAGTFAYSLFSHVLWPLYVPLAALLLEGVRWRRIALVACFAAGSAAGIYLLFNMLRFPIVSRETGGHIEYASPHFYIVVVMAGYLVGTCLSLLFSSHAAVRVFGAAALTAFSLSYVAYTIWLVSVWCFFAAVLSVLVLLYFTRRFGPSKELRHAMAV